MAWYLNKKLLLTTSLLSIPTGYTFYDRYECRQILQKYSHVAKEYGQISLDVDALPARLTCLIQGRNRSEIEKVKEEFMQLVQPLLTFAGIEYSIIEASKLRHAQEYIKLWKEKQDSISYMNTSTEPNDKASHEPEPKPTEEALVPYFNNINEWRLAKWIEKDIQNQFYRSSSTISSTSWGSYLLSWIWWWPKHSPVLSSSTSSSDIKNRSEALEALVGCGSDGAHSHDTKIDKDLLYKAKEALLPKDALQPTSYQDGILCLGGDDDPFSSIISSIHKLCKVYPVEFNQLFSVHALKLGYIPSLYSPLDSFALKAWKFFNKRFHTEQVCQLSLSIVSESLATWSAELEDKYSKKSEKDLELPGLHLPPLLGKIVVFEPIDIRLKLSEKLNVS